jgi:hypothetical protein
MIKDAWSFLYEKAQKLNIMETLSMDINKCISWFGSLRS